MVGFDSFFDAEAGTRATCREKSKYLSPIIGVVVSLLAFLAMMVAVLKMRSRKMVVVEMEEYTLPPVIEEEEVEEIPCYCEVPMENCVVCDEAFAKLVFRTSQKTTKIFTKCNKIIMKDPDILF